MGKKGGRGAGRSKIILGNGDGLQGGDPETDNYDFVFYVYVYI